MTNTSNRPTHRVNLVVERGRNDADFFEIGAAWPTQSGDGFTFEVNVGLQRGDRLYLQEIDWAKIDARRGTHQQPEAVQ